MVFHLPLEEDSLLHLQFQRSHLHRVVVYQQLLLKQYLHHRVVDLQHHLVEGLPHLLAEDHQRHQVEVYRLLQVVDLLHPQDVAHQLLQAVDLQHPQVVAPLLPMHEVHPPLEAEVRQVVGLLDGVLQLEVAEAQQLHLK